MEPFKIILTTNTGRPVLVSEEDYEAVSRFRWFEKRSANKTYVVRSTRIGRRVITKQLHRFIAERAFGRQLSYMDIHHVGGDSFDNRRSQLKPMPRHEHRALPKRCA
jgi:predicted glycoside hydrolase/deacetylase ChbG (UPF0249 family)